MRISHGVVTNFLDLSYAEVAHEVWLDHCQFAGMVDLSRSVFRQSLSMAESNFKATAVSSAGAQGMMQLMPATAAGLGVKDSFNPEQNIMGGTRFLKDLLNRYGGDLDKALAAYNWGPGNLDRSKGRLPRETREYLVKVKKYYDDFSQA